MVHYFHVLVHVLDRIAGLGHQLQGYRVIVEDPSTDSAQGDPTTTVKESATTA